MITLPLLVLFVVFLLIAVRQIGSLRFEIWAVMLGGALAVLFLGQISPTNALHSINMDVMLFLFGMFIVGRAMEDSGYLSYLSYKMFKNAKTADSLLLYILFAFGFLSAILMNDTLAIVGTPVVLLLAKKHKMHATPLLLALAFAVTIGSVMSPIGNPQNLLIALEGSMENPFSSFLLYLFIPTMVCLFLAYFLLKYMYKEQFHNGALNHSKEQIKDQSLAQLSKYSLVVLISLITVKVLLVLFTEWDFKLTYIALLSMLPVVLFSRKRIEIIRSIDWHTLVFFAGMFVLMESVWQTGFFQGLISSTNMTIVSIPSILVVSILLSQLISNVPLVALYLPLLMHAGASTREMVTLAAGSTIAGNLLILGAASNIIIIQNAEKRGKESISFLDFAKVGIPLTIMCAIVYWVFLTIMP